MLLFLFFTEDLSFLKQRNIGFKSITPHCYLEYRNIGRHFTESPDCSIVEIYANQGKNNESPDDNWAFSCEIRYCDDYELREIEADSIDIRKSIRQRIERQRKQQNNKHGILCLLQRTLIF